jgi:hypothetical protein
MLQKFPGWFLDFSDVSSNSVPTTREHPENNTDTI